MTLPQTSPVELFARYERVSTAIVNDVLRSEGLLDQTLPHEIVPLQEGMRIAGFAFTISGERSRDGANDMPDRAAMLEAIPDGAVCVWATGGDNESAQWGEVMTMAAIRRGCRGAVIDGGVRDTDKVLPQKFPVFTRYRSSNGMMGRFRLTSWGTDIVIGGVTIRPGDLVLGDLDGVIIVPAELAERVLGEAEAILRHEVEIKQMVDDGATPGEIVSRGGYF
ncbi:RraA family protein [Occultella kanbiaonis]|uniref:RraA family protein n=1 Tax=Occultella kanbiaonis TaxID=2675754 RepID=UPI001B355712|nr:RraA family protein [Occultella kanbiaonis]